MDWLKVVAAFVRLILGVLLTLGGVSAAWAQSVPVTSGLRIWLDAADVNAGAAQPANGAVVSTWLDKSGNGNTVSAAGTANATFENAGLNGLGSVRMPTNSKLAGPNIFTGATSASTTIFMVHANVTLTSNFMMNLNGDTQAAGATGRFSAHMPWSDGNYYFDAGGCCGTTRLSAGYPVGVAAPVIIALGNSTTAFSGFASTTNEFARFNGTTSTFDADAIAPTVSGGIRIGSTSGAPYDGRFSEVLVYNRALTLAEIRQVECYLGSKWKIAISSGCTAVALSTTKTSAAYSSSTFYPFMVPGAEVIYTINVAYASGNYIDNNSVLLVDKMPANMIFYNADYDGAGPATDPVGFTNGGSPLSWNYASNVRYSNSATAPTTFSGCSYTPIAGYDPNVTYLCINPTGVFTSGSFALNFRAKIK